MGRLQRRECQPVRELSSSGGPSAYGDDQHNVVKLTDNTGAVVESYDYGDYGQPEFYSPPANPGQASGALLDVSESPFGNPYLFTGRRWDEELGYYYFRNRYMDPALGRFVSRDPIGLWGDAANLGNGYTYAASNPWSLVDPFGLEACENGGNSTSVSTGSSIWEKLKFFFSVGPEDKLSSDGADWTKFNGAGSEYLRENDHESRVLRAHEENGKLAEEIVKDGAEIVVSEGVGRVVLAGAGAVVGAGRRQIGKLFEGEFDMALGLARHSVTQDGRLLQNFSRHVDAKTYGDIYGSWWPGSDEKLMLNISNAMKGAKSLKFNLDHLNMNEFANFSKNPVFGPGNYTN